MPKNVGDLGKLIFAKGFKKLPEVQKIAQSGHTVNSIAVSGWLPLESKNTRPKPSVLPISSIFK